jgi:hypothetical protein
MEIVDAVNGRTDSKWIPFFLMRHETRHQSRPVDFQIRRREFQYERAGGASCGRLKIVSPVVPFLFVGGCAGMQYPLEVI